MMADLQTLLMQHRIAVVPEYEGQWHADLYGEEAEVTHTATGDTPMAAVLAVIRWKEQEASRD